MKRIDRQFVCLGVFFQISRRKCLTAPHLIQVHDPVDLELQREGVAVDRLLDVGLRHANRVVQPADGGDLK